MAERGDEVAAVITEPAVFNTGCILPEPGYLELLRAETTKHGALLIFDEVITGFRFAGAAPGVVRRHAGPHDPGQGPRRRVPVAAVGGTREVMDMIAEGRYSHSGTYNANVVQCAAVSATMDVLADPACTRQRALGDRLADGLRDSARSGIPACVEGLGTVFQLWFTDHAIRDWRDAEHYADEAAVHPLVSGDAAARRPVPPEPVREPVRLDGAHRRRRRPDAGGSREALPVVAAKRRDR